jgi:putative aminopeptidase FrvX
VCRLVESDIVVDLAQEICRIPSPLGGEKPFGVYVARRLRDLPEAHEVPYQLEILPRGGTDAGSMQRARGGAAAVTLSIPSCYVHTGNEMANRHDIAGAITLLARFLEDAGSRSYRYES